MILAELHAVFRRRRTWALLGVLGALPVAAGIAIRLAGGPGGGGGPAFLAEVAGNGVVLALAGLTLAGAFFLPLTVAIVSGDALAGEASIGTLRYLVARPVGRVRLLVAKAIGAVAYCFVAAMVIALSGLIVGAILFPVGPVTTLSGIAVSAWSGVGRALLAALIEGMSMVGLALVGVFVSTLTETPVGAMAATAAVFVACLIAEGIPELSAIQPILLTHHWDSFGDVMRVPILWGGVLSDLALQLGWGLVAALAAWARFTSADVLA